MGKRAKNRQKTGNAVVSPFVARPPAVARPDLPASSPAVPALPVSGAPPGPVAASPRAEAGKFAAGVSGNPGGRPKGSRNRVTLLAQDLLEDGGEAIIAKAVELAKAGDPVALRLCVERILPRSRGTVVEIALPSIARASDLLSASTAVVAAAGAGKISLAEAREFLQLLDVHRKIVEMDDLAVRIQVLERGSRQ